MLKYLTAILILPCCSMASSNIYVDGGIGYASAKNWSRGSMALNLNTGYNFNPNFALEAGAAYILPQNNYTDGVFYTAHQSWLDLAAKGSLRISPIANLYIKGGVATGFSSSSAAISSLNYSANQTNTSLAILAGLGINFDLTKSFKLKAENYGIVPITNTGFGSVNVFSIGASYSF